MKLQMDTVFSVEGLRTVLGTLCAGSMRVTVKDRNGVVCEVVALETGGRGTRQYVELVAGKPVQD